MQGRFKKRVSTIAAPLFVVLLAAPVVVHAQLAITSAWSLLAFIARAINAIIPVLIGLGVLYFIWGVVQYVASGDDKERREKGRKKIVFGIIAIFVMFSVWGLVNILGRSLGLFNVSQVPQIPAGSSGPTPPPTLNAPTPIVPCGTTNTPRCQFCHLWQLAKNIIDFLMVAIIPLVGIGIAYGGFMMLVSGGNEGRFSRGKDAISYAIWGLIIALIAWLIINTIIQFIANPGAFPFSGSWFGLPPCP